MEIQIQETKGIVIMKLSGEFDLYEASKVREAVDSFLSPQKNRLIMDMEKVSYLDSSGVGTLIHLQNLAGKVQGKLVICSLRESPLKVLTLTRLTKFFIITDSLSKGIEIMN